MTKLLQYLSPAVFLVACCLPSLELRVSDGTKDVMLGLRVLAIGWSGIFAGVLAWYANPVWLLGVGMTFWKKPTVGIIAGIVALAIGYTTLSLIGRALPADEGNVKKMTVVRILPGFYVWMSSLALLTLTSLVQRFRS
ncbi:MAG: hypothetical protein H7Z40_01940 [Phycisphaerae bacterium]|nr:hypothetical protein [Gemmatimonadaceae bacterium]